MEIDCDWCCQPFVTSQSFNPSRFCSKHCRDQSRYKDQRDVLLQARIERSCQHCNEPIPLTRDGKAKYCSKSCQRQAAQDRRTPEHLANLRFIRRYGLTIDQRDALLAQQGGQCALCGSDSPGTQGWAIDHDHRCCNPHSKNTALCGQCIRGVLCGRCNLGLGAFDDDPALLRRAANYLDDYAAGLL